MLAVESERITFEDDLTKAISKLEFVMSLFPDPGYKDLPDSRLDPFAHGMEAAVPAVEVANDGNSLCVRAPDREKYAGMAVYFHKMGAEFSVYLVVGTLAIQMHVQIAKERSKRVGVSE